MTPTVIGNVLQESEWMFDGLKNLPVEDEAVS